MKARIELVARGVITVDIDEAQKSRIEEEVFGPIDLDDFERLTVINLEVTDKREGGLSNLLADLEKALKLI